MATIPTFRLTPPDDELLATSPNKVMDVIVSIPEEQRNYLLILLSMEAVMVYTRPQASSKEVLKEIEQVIRCLHRLTCFLNDYDDIIATAEESDTELFTPSEGLEAVFRDFLKKEFWNDKKKANG